jgi:N-methylhydantoinase A/oxoprolinase/acetone carboxylase beta subunit
LLSFASTRSPLISNNSFRFINSSCFSLSLLFDLHCSTDVSRYAGAYEHIFENVTAGVTIQAPQLDISTVAAGGGSILAFRTGLFNVGPDSAGAFPGPACYRNGGPLTVTDANLFLGRLVPAQFPSIFGEGKNQPLDTAVVALKFNALCDEINAYFDAERAERRRRTSVTAGISNSGDGNGGGGGGGGGGGVGDNGGGDGVVDVHENTRAFTPASVALGFLRVANEASK